MTESPPTEDNQDNNDKYVHEEEEDEDEDDAQEEMGCDLASLFINTEYVTQSITIPCHYSQQSNNNHNHNHEEKDLTVDILCSQSATTDYDLTGQVIWPVSLLLSHYVTSAKGQEITSNKRVIELGAGCGLPGLVAANFAKHVTLTDGNETVVELLQTNCDNYVSVLSSSSSSSSSQTDSTSTAHTPTMNAVPFQWGNGSQLSQIVETSGPFDVILAADVVQWPAVVEPLLHTMKALLWNSNSSITTSSSISSSSDTNTNNNSNPDNTCQSEQESKCCILGIVERAQSTYRMFFEMATELGFQSRKIPMTEFLEGGMIPESCQEHGGRKTQLFELKLVDFSVPPILLEHVDVDIIVGKSYENTCFLPC